MRFIAPLMMLALAGLLACASDDAVFGNGTGSGGSASTTTASGAGAGGGTTSSSSSTSTSGGAGGSGGSATPCSFGDSNPCGDGEYCNAPDCMTGFCEARPMMGDSMKAPVCGCDGVNYWNATTAALFGMSVEAAGECGMPTTCGQTKPCPTMRLSCGELIENAIQCNLGNNNARGVCWGMPETCPTTDDRPYRSCNITQLACVGECQAIKSDAAHHPDLLCN